MTGQLKHVTNKDHDKKPRTKEPAAKQFNFARQWKNIVPHLSDPAVSSALTVGMKLLNSDYVPGDPPCWCGRGGANGQRAYKGCLSWHQPWGRCHNIAPFCWALGNKLYPDLNWGFISGDLHTVVVGWSHDWEKPEWVLDILLFREYTAQESLDFAMQEHWDFCPSLDDYLMLLYLEDADYHTIRSVYPDFEEIEVEHDLIVPEHAIA
jgi:hypothetical protein